jgi:hypothetical protein
LIERLIDYHHRTSRAWRRRAGIWSLDSVAIDTSLSLISIFDEDESLAGWNDVNVLFTVSIEMSDK